MLLKITQLTVFQIECIPCDRDTYSGGFGRSDCRHCSEGFIAPGDLFLKILCQEHSVLQWLYF